MSCNSSYFNTNTTAKHDPGRVLLLNVANKITECFLKFFFWLQWFLFESGLKKRGLSNSRDSNLWCGGLTGHMLYRCASYHIVETDKHMNVANFIKTIINQCAKVWQYDFIPTYFLLRKKSSVSRLQPNYPTHLWSLGRIKNLVCFLLWVLRCGLDWSRMKVWGISG